MAAAPFGSIEIPIFARFNGEDIELGTIEIPIKFTLAPPDGA